MANFVVKKDGTKSPFDVEKMKAGIKSAAIEAELSGNEASNVAEEISSLVTASIEDQEEVSSTSVREKILSELDISYPIIAEAWRSYEESKG